MNSSEAEIPSTYTWVVVHRRLVLSIVSGVAGILTLTLGWFQVSDTTIIAEQLSWIAGAGLLGIFLLGVAAIAYWAEQRERELTRLTAIEMYVAAVADAMGLTEAVPPSGNGVTPLSSTAAGAPAPTTTAGSVAAPLD